jgi:transposase InsO family protein
MAWNPHHTFVLTDEHRRLPKNGLQRRAAATCRIQRPCAAAQPRPPLLGGTLKGVGTVYVQVVVDTYCSLPFAKLYPSKMPITPADLLIDRVLPFYEAIGVDVGAVLTDNGREFCGKPEEHPFELVLAMHDVEHRRTKIATPRTNGFVERMNRTLLDECFRVAGRQTWYLTPAEIQRDLDAFLRYYNQERSHQGYRLKGRTPALALQQALQTDVLPPIDPEAEEAPEPDADTHAA